MDTVCGSESSYREKGVWMYAGKVVGSVRCCRMCHVGELYCKEREHGMKEERDAESAADCKLCLFCGP